MYCENCNIVHDGKYASGRFCSYKCSRGFSTKNKRKEINEKISKSLSGREFSAEHKANIKKNWKAGKKPNILTYENVFIENSKRSNQDVKKFLVENNIKAYKCEECFLTQWQNKSIILQLHHINGKNTDNRLENLLLLCPNCHSQTDNWSGKKRK